MNYLTLKELVENLSILLEGEELVSDSQTECLLPSEDDIYQMVQSDGCTECTGFPLQQPLAVVWDGEDGTRY